MKKLINRVVFCLMAAVLIWCAGVLADRQKLNEELIRLHVVANSDSGEDQAVKLRVRDAVVESLRSDMEKIGDVAQARDYLRENLPRLEKIANDALRAAGVDAKAVAKLTRETFDTREYDTFTLPAGVYQALRITIGEGEGKNWWCVVFPDLCLPATTSEFTSVAAGAGFADSLTAALEGEQGYEIRFFLLDALGRMENMLFLG